MTLYCIISEADSCCFIFYTCFPFPQKQTKQNTLKKIIVDTKANNKNKIICRVH